VRAENYYRLSLFYVLACRFCTKAWRACTKPRCRRTRAWCAVLCRGAAFYRVVRRFIAPNSRTRAWCAVLSLRAPFWLLRARFRKLRAAFYCSVRLVEGVVQSFYRVVRDLVASCGVLLRRAPFGSSVRKMFADFRDFACNKRATFVWNAHL